MEFDKKQVEIVEKTRRLSFPDFDKIELSDDGVRIIVNLFLNPDCLVDVNLEIFTKQDRVHLVDLSKHIMTTAPATLAEYAQTRKKFFLTRDDVIECFAFDHLDVIETNQIVDLKGATYALAHAMSPALVVGLAESDGIMTTELKQDQIVYKNVVVPTNLNLQIDDRVWHHFGVVIDKISPTDMDLVDKQQNHDHWRAICEQAQDKEIDFTNVNVFKKNVFAKILAEVANRQGDNYKPLASDDEVIHAATNNSQINKITFTN